MLHTRRQPSACRQPHTILTCFFATIATLGYVGSAQAQNQPATGTQAAGAPMQIPPPEELTIDTKDGVLLRATFFPGTKGKESVPVILLHPFKSNRHSFGTLPKFLQENNGYAVITVDLRGHGDSTSARSIDGKVVKLSADSLRPIDFAMMVKYDVSAVIDHLIGRNDKGELNVDKTTIVGAEMGSVVGFLGAVVDWSWPVLATGKQGQYVKALALLSPVVAFKGLSMSNVSIAIKPDDANMGMQNLVEAAKLVRTNAAVYIAVGKGTSSAVAEADRVHKLFQRKPPQTAEEQTLFYDDTLDTKLQGVQLVTEKSLGMEARIARFIELKVESQPFPWAMRRTPVGAAAGT
jgi:pimeloyl-ACP methyl ester carboxylesterase